MTDQIADVEALCRGYGADATAVAAMDPGLRREFFWFRARCLAEELAELDRAGSAEDAVDALVDLTVFALGTLVSFGVDAREAWRRVHEANSAKVRGVKGERPNPFGLPDLVKPAGWTPPDHSGNVGLVAEVYRV